MKIKVDFVDAFTDTLFAGNPAGVVILEEWLPEQIMQSIATENNLSETAFSVKNTEDIYSIRWFSPLKEIAFCGHATLATASVLFCVDSSLNSVCFDAKAVGKLNVKKIEDGAIEMSFPANMPNPVESIPADLLAGLSIAPKEVFLNRQAYFAVYESEEDVLAVTQNKDRIVKLAPYDVVVTSPGGDYDFVSRYFWPANGGDEDPVTGSIHTGLAPLWSQKLNKTKMIAYQASKRGGVLSCSVEGDRILLSGKAVHYLQGFINI